MQGKRPRVILVTDGDEIAQRALEKAAKIIRARVISRSAGNPTPLAGTEIVELILLAAHDPVIVMLDDNGTWGQGPGEQALRILVEDQRIRVIGVLAVASNTRYVRGVAVGFSL
ncbi:stage V sporulation protein AE, partial [Sulfoacidibacillus thermotolerans]